MPKKTAQATIGHQLKRTPAITFDDLAYELRELRDCLTSDTYPRDADLTAARFLADSLLAKLKQTPHVGLLM
jgi:hypothetical protein